MRDEKRKEIALMEEAYSKVNEMSVSPVLDTPQTIAIKVPTSPEDGECGCSNACGCRENDPSEIDMAGRDLLKAHDYAAKLSEMVQQLPGLDGWVASKITKASDYLSSVYHYLDYEMNEKHNDGKIDHNQEHGQPGIAVMVKQPQEDNFNMGYEEV